MSEAVQLSRRMTLAEFLAWNSGDAPGDGRRWQLVDGQPQAMAPALPVHSAVQSETLRLLANHLARLGRPCVVLPEAGISPPGRTADNFRIPDLVVTCTTRDLGGRLIANPVVAIEILSPSNHAETWNNVWSFTAIPSLREILILRCDRVDGAVLRCRADGSWPEAAEPVGDTLVLESLSYAAPLADLYRIARLAPEWES